MIFIRLCEAERWCEHNTGGASPSPTEVCEEAFVCAKPKDRANIIREDMESSPTDYILFGTVGADSISARKKQTARTTKMAENRISLLNRRGRRPRRPEKQTARINNMAAHQIPHLL